MITILYIRSSLQSLALETSTTGYPHPLIKHLPSQLQKVVYQALARLHLYLPVHASLQPWCKRMAMKSCSESTKAIVMYWYHLCASPTH